MGMAHAFEKVALQMIASQNKNEKDHSHLMTKLDPKQRKALELFLECKVITSNQIGELFGFKARTRSALCKKWTDKGFLEIVDPSNKARKYKLAAKYDPLLK